MKRTSLDVLPGFKCLLGMLEAHGLKVELHPPVPSAPRSGDLVAGKPFDPVLARLYAYCDGGRLGDLILMSASKQTGGLADSNENLTTNDNPRRGATLLLCACLVLAARHGNSTFPSRCQGRTAGRVGNGF